MNNLWDCITVIEAQNLLTSLTIADWPNMKKEGREKLHRSLSRKAYPDTFKGKKKVSLEELDKILKG